MKRKEDIYRAVYLMALIVAAHVGTYAMIGRIKTWCYLFMVPAFAWVLDRIRKTCKMQRSLMILSFLMALAQLVGENYDVSVYISNLWDGKAAAADSLLRLAGYTVLLAAGLHVLLHILQKKETQEKLFTAQKTDRIGKAWARYSAVFLIGWLPVLITGYPGHLMGDSKDQLCQFFGIPVPLSTAMVLIDPDVLITNHHPLLHTVLMGGCVKIGRTLFGSDNIGLFLFATLQYIAMCLTLGYAVAWLLKIGASRLTRWAVLAFFFVLPCFWESTVLTTKDTPFAIVLMLFVLKTAELMLGRKEKLTRRWWLVYILEITFVLLFRNNGFYVVILALPVAAIAGKGLRKPILAAIAFTLVLQVGWNSVALPAMKITAGSKAEMLALPFQQTGRYMHEFEAEITPEEKEVISAVLDYDRVMRNYNPRKGDPTKFSYIKTATGEDLKNYFITWFKMGLKHPACYLQATACSLNGYYSFGTVCPWGYSVASAKGAMDKANRNGFSFSLPSWLEPGRKLMLKIMKAETQYFPATFLLLQAALYDWWLVVAIIWLLLRKRWRAAAVMMPAFVLLLTNLAGPVNARTYFRYTTPIVMMAPILTVILVRMRKTNTKEETML